MEWECCWAKPEIQQVDCPNIAEGEEDLYHLHRRRLVEKCLECNGFRNDLERLQQMQSPMAEVIPFLVSEVLDLKSQVSSMASFLTTKSREIKFLHELSVVLQTTLDLDEVLSVALTAITAGKGFGLNRAFLLMVDKERRFLKGYLGVGPRNFEEAWHIWEEINQHSVSLRVMAANFQKNKLPAERAKFRDILEGLTVPLDRHDHLFNRALQERRPILVQDAFHNPQVEPQLASLLGVDTFLVMPLISVHRRIGVIVADNCITHKPITPQDMQSLETFAFPVAFALERASLYDRVQEQVEQLTAVNAKLQEQQDLIVRMEKMALMGRITSSIAHSIRNPLMVIGGFARSLLKNSTTDDPRRDYLESIVRESKTLEDALTEVLNYSDSLFPAIDRWDLNQLVASVCQEMHGALEQRGLACHTNFASDLPRIYVDFKKIAYVLRTIATTIMDKTSDVSRIEVRTYWDSEAAYIEISHDGRRQASGPGGEPGTILLSAGDLATIPGLELCRSILEKYGNHFTIKDLPDGRICYTIRILLTREGESDDQNTGS